ncbi:phage portal protein [Labilibacter sediminis]|nr:phage portal protein [Labilibacter sediminis]
MKNKALDVIFGVDNETKRNLDLTTTNTYNDYQNDFQFLNFSRKLKNINEEKIAPLSTAHKILAENIGRIPIVIKRDGEIIKDHPLYQILNLKPNTYSNISTFKTAIEYDRNKFGNSFAKINRNRSNGQIKSIEYIVSDKNTTYRKRGDNIYYTFSDGGNKKVVNGIDLLHFRQPLLTTGGIMGITPITALNYNLDIIAKGMHTINNFYDNNLISPLVAETTVATNAQRKTVKEEAENFANNYGGYNNAGKIIPLPPNVKLTPLHISLIDSQILDSLKLNTSQIASLFGIPNYMMNDVDNTQGLEQQLLQFKSFTLAPIVSIYEAELNFKLLTNKELIEGYKISFDMDMINDADLKTKATSYTLLSKNALMTKNEGIEKLGNKKIKGDAGDKHYQQMQDVAIEDLDKIKVDNKVQNEGK